MVLDDSRDQSMKVIRVKVPSVRPMVRCSLKKVLRTMPSVVLLIFVFGLIFLTLMQIAVIHANRRSLYHPSSTPVSSATAAAAAAAAAASAVATSTRAPAPAKQPEVMRVEAFVDKNAPTVEANMVALQADINQARVRDLVAEFAQGLNGVASNGTSQFPEMHRKTFQVLDQNQTRYNRTLVTTSVTPRPLCPEVPPHLVGRIKVNTTGHWTWSDISTANPEVSKGGGGQPVGCRSRHRVAVVIPYRDREEHLAILLHHLSPILVRQQLHFKIYVVEQFGNDTFNKGVLMNAGVREALKEADYHCFVFHDVDMIPEDDRNMYSCPENPRHMSVGVDKFNYSLPYTLLVGGVFAIRTEHLALVNGYSNLYWGWGGEDDDIAYRIKYRKLPIIRPPEALGRYSMIKHEHRPESPNNVRSALLRMSKRRSSRDGLNSVKYKLVFKNERAMFTHLMIDIGTNHRWKFVQGKKLIISF